MPLAEQCFDEIWDALEQRFGVKFSASIREKLTREDSCLLSECTNCGLEYFTPAIGGDERFYETLSASPLYYELDRWEFHRARRYIQDGGCVVDVGAGEGQFLKVVRDQTAERYAVEPNRRAAESLRNSDIAVVDSLEALARRRIRVDAVTMFQVIEHVADLRSMIVNAKAILAPGGYLLISVPNRRRIRSGQLEPLDFPPHHLTRWASDQLEFLGLQFGLCLRSIEMEPPDLSRIAHFYTDEGLRRYAWLGRNGCNLAMRIQRKLMLTSLVMKITRQGNRLVMKGCTGHTMLAVYQVA